MQTVDKAMKVLSLFTTEKPEIGLSELSRMAKIDKAGTRRLLVALQKHAYIEQNLETKDYRLGFGFLHLARVREATFPMESVIAPILLDLTAKTEETAHASLACGVETNLMTIGVSPSTRSIRVHLQYDEALPIHATASGIAYLSFSSKERFDELISPKMDRFTPDTLCSVEAIKAEVDVAFQRGYAVSNQTLEEGAYGVAVPFFDALSIPCGAVSIASPSSRMNPQREIAFANYVVEASLAITKAIGGKPSSEFLARNEQRIK